MTDQAHPDVVEEQAVQAQSGEAQEVPIEVFCGQIINTLTGEVIGPAPGQEKFAVTDEASLERWLQMIGRTEDLPTTYEGRMDVQSARALLNSELVLEAQRIVRNVDAVRAAAEKRKAGIIAWQKANVVDVVRRLLTERKSKAKSIQTPYGTVALTTFAPKIEVEDTDKALAFAVLAEDEACYKVTYSVQKTPVKKVAEELVADWKSTTIAVETLEDDAARCAALNRLTAIQSQLADIGCRVVGTQTKVEVTSG